MPETPNVVHTALTNINEICLKKKSNAKSDVLGKIANAGIQDAHALDVSKV